MLVQLKVKHRKQTLFCHLLTKLLEPPRRNTHAELIDTDEFRLLLRLSSGCEQQIGSYFMSVLSSGRLSESEPDAAIIVT